MSRPSRSALARALFCALAFVLAWLSLEGAARAQGSDKCGAPPPLLSSTDTGTTVGMANDTSTIALACNGTYTNVAGPDVFYEIDVGPGSGTFVITVTPSAGYDTSIYLTHPACGDGAECSTNWGADTFYAGHAESVTLSGLSTGVYYLGIGSFYGASDARGQGTYAVSVNGNLGSIPTSTTVQGNPPSSVFGQPVTFTATVTGFLGAAAGTVTFAIDGASQPPVAVNAAGQAVFTTSTMAAGSHTVTAVYGGSAPYVTSTGTVMQTVAPANTTTTLLSSANPSMQGVPVTFTASVVTNAPGAGTPTGSVTFAIDGTQQAMVMLDMSGNAAFTTSILGPGPHAIVATYADDPNFPNFTPSSGALTQTVLGNPTMTAVVAAPEPSVYGQSVAFTATVTPGGGGAPTGSVTFSLDGAPVGSPALNGSGVATFVTSAIAPGTHTMTATYAGDPSHAGSTGSTTHVVSQASTATALSFSPNPAVAVQELSLTATVVAVAPGAGTPTGVVTFSDGTTTLGTATLSGGVAILNWGFDAGPHSITATYGGDPFFLGSSSGAQSLTINKDATTTNLATSSNPSAFGAPLTLTASVSTNSPGNGVPTGTVTFLNGSATLGTGTVDTNGHAVFSTSTLAVGTYSITASYGGDADRNGSTSAVLTQKITMDSVTLAVASSANPAALGTNVTFTATVSAPGDAGTPTGSVTFTDGTTMLGTVTLSGGVAAYSTSTLSGGEHTITATYSGDTTFTGGASGSVVETISAAATTTALAATPNPATFGSPVTLQATVTSTVSGTPTGVVAFVDGTSSLGTAPLSGNTASFTTSSLSLGTHPIHAAYAGDTNFAGSVSPDVTETIVAPVSDAGVADGAGHDAETDGPTETSVDGTVSGDAEVDGGPDGAADAGADGSSSDANSSDSAAGPGEAGSDAAMMGDGSTFDGSITAPDAGAGTNESGSCGCRVAGGEDAGGGLLALAGFVAVATAFAGRRSQRRRDASR
jgi:hypothetical protein